MICVSKPPSLEISNKIKKSHAQSFKLDTKLKSDRDRYKPKEHRINDFNTKIITVDKLYNPSRKVIDLSDSVMNKSSNKGSMLNSERIQRQKGLDVEISPKADMTPLIFEAKSRTFNNRLIGQAKNKTNDPQNLYSSSDVDKLSNRYSMRVKDTGKLSKHQNPGVGPIHSSRSISYLEKARVRNKRAYKSPVLLYRNYKIAKDRIKSTGTLSRKGYDHPRIQSKIGTYQQQDSNLPTKNIKSEEAKILMSKKSSFDTDKCIKTDRNSREMLKKFGPNQIYYGQVDFTSGDEYDELKYDSGHFSSSEKRLTINKNLRDYESSVTEEEKFLKRPIQDRYLKDNKDYGQTHGVVNPYAKMVIPEGDCESEELKDRQEIMDVQDDEPSNLEFTKRQNLTQLLKDINSGENEERVDGGADVSSDPKKLDFDHDSELGQSRKIVRNDEKLGHAFENMDKVQDVFLLDDEQKRQIKPELHQDILPDTQGKGRLVQQNIKSSPLNQDDPSNTFKEEFKIVIPKTDSTGPIISKGFAKRQSSVHEEHVQGILTPNKRPKNIVDMVDNIEEQFDNFEDDFNEYITEEDVKRQDFRLQHMQSDQVYINANKDDEQVLEHPEQIYVSAKPRERRQSQDDAQDFDNFKGVEEIKKQDDDRRDFVSDDEVWQLRNKPQIDSPHDKHDGDVQGINDIDELDDKNMMASDVQMELFDVDNNIKRKANFEILQYDEDFEVRTKVLHDQARKIKREGSLDSTDEHKEPNNTSRL